MNPSSPGKRGTLVLPIVIEKKGGCDVFSGGPVIGRREGKKNPMTVDKFRNVQTKRFYPTLHES